MDDHRSLTGARWLPPPPAPPCAKEISQKTGLSEVAAALLCQRFGEDAPEVALNPSLADLHDPRLMLNMEAALTRLKRAIANRERVRILTDYDVDGTTSSLILQAALRLAGHDPERLDYHIPDRFVEGYGFSVRAAQRAIEDGVDLILTADIGVRDHEAVRVARAGGVDVLVCDHHLPAGMSVPPDAIVLCPPQEGCTYPNDKLAACGVSLKVAQGLLEEHPNRGAIVRSLLKLAAMGTVADMVSLTKRENRAIVSLGLQELNQGAHSPGLQALLEVCDLAGKPIRASDLGYRVGPRINAAGRLAEATLVIDLLHAPDLESARTRAAHLNTLNQERQGIQRRLTELALKQAKDEKGLFAVISGPEAEGWHRGVVGIVATRVKDELGLPVAIVSIQGEFAVGSVRSIPAVNAVSALESVGDLLVKFGGHAGAAGFTLRTELLDVFRARLHDYVAAHSTDEMRVTEYGADVVLSAAQLTEGLIEELDRLGPFGVGNPRPRLLVSGVLLSAVEVRAQGRLLRGLIPRAGAAPVEAVWWEHGELQGAFREGTLDLLGALQTHEYNGRRFLQFHVEDARRAKV